MCTSSQKYLDTWNFKGGSSITNIENKAIFYFFTAGKIQDFFR